MEIEGRVLAGKYRLERFLGSGGFASVWAARNLDLDRPVAVKILADNFVRIPGAVERFTREARIASRHIHPAVLRVEDICRTQEGVPFLVMELLEGRTLDETLVAGGPLPVAECLPLIRVLLEGLAAAHALGIIHRDIKPANIFLVSPEFPGSRLRILDMGLAKDIAEESGLTRTGQLMGTPDFLAPEILLETERDCWTPQVDVFAAGMVAFAMLTGRLPFGKPSKGPVEARIAERILDYARGKPLAGPRWFNLGVPDAVDAVVTRALELSPFERFSDAGVMLLAFDNALAETPAAAPQGASSSITRPRSERDVSSAVGTSGDTPLSWSNGELGPPVGTARRGRRWVVAALVAACVAVLAGAGVTLWSMRGVEPEETVLVPAVAVPPATASKLGPEVAAAVDAGPRRAELPASDGSTVADAAGSGSFDASVPDLVKVRLVGVPDRASVSFADVSVRGEWIEGPEGMEDWLVVRADGFEHYRTKLTLEPGLVLDLDGRLRRRERRSGHHAGEAPSKTPGSRPSNSYIEGARNTKIKAYYPPRPPGGPSM